MKSSPFWTIFIVTFICLYGCKGDSPFCQKCRCSKEVPMVIDCGSTDIINVFEEYNWKHHITKIPYSIAALNLSRIYLGNINKQIPPSNLTLLDLSHNFIRTLDNNVFSNLENMETLILSYNAIEDVNPEAFRGFRVDGDDYPLRSLRKLYLSHNYIKTLPQNAFEHVENRLKVLDISFNPLKVIDHQTQLAISSLVDLEELYLGNTEIMELPQYFLHTPKYLKVLDISGNDLESIPKALSESKSLYELDISYTLLTVLGGKHVFPKIETLKVLRLNNMPMLRRIGANTLSNLINLEELHISNNIGLFSIDANMLSRKEEENEVWPPIKKLYLSNNMLTHLDSHIIGRWDKLTDLDIRGNPWTCECENQWLVEDLMPLYVKINYSQAQEVQCAAPIEMGQYTLYELYQKKSEMRCLDLYDHTPERDASILVGVLIGVLIGIPIILLGIWIYQKYFYNYFDNSPAAYSRKFYSRTNSGEF